IRTILPYLQKLASRFDSQIADRELLRQFSVGRDEAAFAELVRRHHPMLLRVCERVLHDEHDAEDVCQAAFLLLAQRAAGVRWHKGRGRLRVRLARRGVWFGTALTSAWLLEAGARAGCANVAPQAIAKAALSIATGKATLAGVLPAWVAALATGATRTMFLRK